MNSIIAKYKRHISFFFLLTFVTNVFFPTATWALTSGPTQPEVHNFQPISVADMVDPSTGDFSYNIPLMDIDGYPVNISYKSGIGMDQEASNVGLGWTLNIGSINRNLRGIPDDFDGEEIIKKMNLKENESAAVTIGVGGELFGVDPIQASYAQTITYNTYTGYGFTQKSGFNANLGGGVGVGLGVASSGDGLTISPSISYQVTLLNLSKSTNVGGSVTLGTSYNSRVGIKEVSLSAGLSMSVKEGKAVETINEDGTTSTHTEYSPNGTTIAQASTHSSITFGSPSYAPIINMSTHTKAYAGSVKIGGAVFGLDLHGEAAVNWSKESLVTKETHKKAYGYLNLQNGQTATDAILDFNREKDGNFSEATTNLAIPNLTYDNFSVAGQGVGGAFRPHRSDVGYVYDPETTNNSESTSANTEAGIGSIFTLGTDVTQTNITGRSGVWVDKNTAAPQIGFSHSGTGSLDYEAAYFKEMGEMSVDDDALWANIHEEKAVRYRLNDLESPAQLSENLINENSVEFIINSKHRRTKRVKRNQLFSYLTLSDAKNFGLQKHLYEAQIGHPVPLVSSNARENHIAEITTTKTDGARYVYGLPAYNNSQLEASFSLNYNPTDDAAKKHGTLIEYESGVDDTPLNQKGVNNFFTSTEMPAYAYGYMLTAVLSADYVDRTGNGPTKDDLGNYTLFNYKKHESNYQWRGPYCIKSGGTQIRDAANHEEGLLTDDYDDKGSYVYGTKEIYYLDNIETKNHIALFSYSDRRDAHGADGTSGGLSTTDTQQKLDLITLYSKPDYQLKTTYPSYDPFVMKQVHFTYDYELCPGVYNNQHGTDAANPVNQEGKLTLKELYFTYGKSNKGKLSPYKFNYNNKVIGADVYYDPASIDRWGGYKPNDTSLPNSRFPYTIKDKYLQDEYSRLWNLNSIQLPSGGLLELELEADDYAYVQNKQACEMFKLAGIAKYISSSATSYASEIGNNTLFWNLTASDEIVLLFELKDNITPIQDISSYFSEIDKLYFNCKVNVLNYTSNSTAFEYIHGYCDINKQHSGYFQAGNKQYGYIKVNNVRRGDKLSVSTTENPISKATWQFDRLYKPKQAYSIDPANASDPASGTNDPASLLTAIADADFMKNVIQFYEGANGALKANHVGEKCKVDESWIRLNSPDKIKLAGGSRVKQITIRDQWDKMLNGPAAQFQGFQYGQSYNYTVEEEGKVISSGVAGYEPSFGADENPFRQPVFMDMHKEEALLAPDNDMYVEEPMGESFFPPATIIYSRVTTTNLYQGTGKTVNEFYTARDFPTIVHSLGMEAKRQKPKPIAKLFSFLAYDRFSGSQGYSIEVNDMHGKPKAIHLYEEGMASSSKSNKYFYKSTGNRLDNKVTTVGKNGSINYNTRIGVDFDFYADFRQNKSRTEALGVNINVAMWYSGAPIIIPVMLPTRHEEEIELRTAVTNKVIYKYGILDRVETTDNANTMTTQNLLWDSETGHVLLTETNTEFEDPIYTLKYPSHWAYEGTGGGYKNIGFEINNPGTYGFLASGQVSDVNYKKLLHPGDELAIYTTSGGIQKGWIEKIGAQYFIINASGVVQTKAAFQLASVSKIKVIRSGRRNLQDMNVGAITTFTNPLYNTPNYWPAFNQSYGILNATSVELGNKFGTYCGCSDNPFIPGDAYNGYLQGTEGNYKVLKNYTYLTTRKQEKVNNNSNIRVDGTFQTFSPFFTPSGANDWVPNTANWQWASSVTKNNPYGLELENVDPLYRYSSALYGYQQTLPVAISNNSKFKQMANENFEYNDLNFCADNHFGFNQYSSYTYMTQSAAQVAKVQKYSHTGKRSIKVKHGNTDPAIIITKQLTPCQ